MGPRTFTDAAGQSWSVVVTVDTLRRVRQLAGVDLMQAIGGKLLEQLATDPVLLVDVLAAVCKPQLDARSTTAEAFAQGLVGDAIDAAAHALLLGLADFSPSPTRKLLMRLIDAGRASQLKAQDLAMAHLDRLMMTVDGASSPNPPASSDTTPAP
jgi:hypothetical protein